MARYVRPLWDGLLEAIVSGQLAGFAGLYAARLGAGVVLINPLAKTIVL